jgi:hypothetical protein
MMPAKRVRLEARVTAGRRAGGAGAVGGVEFCADILLLLNYIEIGAKHVTLLWRPWHLAVVFLWLN